MRQPNCKKVFGGIWILSSKSLWGKELGILKIPENSLKMVRGEDW
jgi:hypothetical protein